MNPEKENKTELTEEEKNTVFKLATGDWGNEFIKSCGILEMFEFTKKPSDLFSKKGEKYILKLFWERYENYGKEKILTLEKDYPELEKMRKVVEYHIEIMENVYNLLEENYDYESDEFWNKMRGFIEKARSSFNIFEENKAKLAERIK